LAKILKKGEKVLLNDNEAIPLFEKEGESKYKSQCISPIVCMGDVYGAVVAYSTNKQLTEKEADFILNASLLFCGQLR
jgi:LytS/YehU family sensor histidine kinase